ncbi:hypothetical protein SMIR_39005 [Streptomyces mirabilis]|uniref:hypothetical protein n=1 Tax=Streptomyces mirabilis TaxID=68239 RepID=UPI001BAEC3F4|nr:hypothetical protein [Streptomyces mirabilis]QUW84388.1 hypothetical protein SMIR_39005 [Streptomyces mirabilis]
MIASGELMVDGRRKSIQAMASRLPDASAPRVPDARSYRSDPAPAASATVSLLVPFVPSDVL